MEHQLKALPTSDLSINLADGPFSKAPVPLGSTKLKICHWTRIPNHYQKAFIDALGKICDLKTVYFEGLLPDRLALGWDDSTQLTSKEFRCLTLPSALEAVSDWRDRIHIVPGYGGPFQRQLARHLSENLIPWADWSESSTPGWKWYARLPVKIWWSYLVSRSALGSFAIGIQAEDDFVRRGLGRSKISYLPYVTKPFDVSVKADSIMHSFKAGRKAFVFLGTLNQRKGIDLLLKAITPVLKDHDGWTLILVGNDTKDRKYKRLAFTLGISSQTLFRGSVSPRLIGSVVLASDVVVLPSRYDGWGVAINEAVNGGRAVIASDQCGAAKNLVVPGYNGFRVRAGRQSDLGVALRRYATTQDLSVSHGKASKEISKDVDPDLNARRMLLNLSVWLNDKSL